MRPTLVRRVGDFSFQGGVFMIWVLPNVDDLNDRRYLVRAAVFRVHNLQVPRVLSLCR